MVLGSQGNCFGGGFAFWGRNTSAQQIREMISSLTYTNLFYQLSNEENPGCLGYIGDYTAQFYGD